MPIRQVYDSSMVHMGRLLVPWKIIRYFHRDLAAMDWVGRESKVEATYFRIDNLIGISNDSYAFLHAAEG